MQTHHADVKVAALEERGVLRVAGEDAGKFLQGVITNDVERLGSEPAIFAGLLAPQGKILFEFFLVAAPPGYLLEADKAELAALAKRLTLYKLRARVEIADASRDYRVFAAWGPPAWRPPALQALAFPDPRLAALGWRILAASGEASAAIAAALSGAVASARDWDLNRIALGVPQAGRDYALGETFPHEADFDDLQGVSFAKGCFVGQEVVSRMQHSTMVRKRIVPVEGEAPLQSNVAVTAGTAEIGRIGSVAGRRALALLRLDRAAAARAAGLALRAGDVAIRLVRPGWAKFDLEPNPRREPR
jgi:folate-binding protein YgfZ